MMIKLLYFLAIIAIVLNQKLVEEGREYYIFTNMKTDYQEALKSCRKARGYLTSIINRDTFDYLVANIRSRPPAKERRFFLIVSAITLMKKKSKRSKKIARFGSVGVMCLSKETNLVSSVQEPNLKKKTLRLPNAAFIH